MATVNLFGTNLNNAVNFVNCIGGSGGAANYGLLNGAPLTVNYTPGGLATLYFRDVVGGSGTGNGHNGINNTSTISAPVIIATDIYGGAGTNNDIGFNNTGTIGSSTITSLISITAGSLGTGVNEYGIQNAGTIQVTNSGTINLNGTGGGVYNYGGISSNHGIVLNGGSLSAGTAVGSECQYNQYYRHRRRRQRQ